jgi:hypothetical protein
MAMARKENLKFKIQNSKLLKRLLSILFLIIIATNLLTTVWSQKEKYISTDYWQRFPVLEKTYLSSQYVNKHPVGWVPDEGIQAYTGGAFIKGINPVLVLPDTPPLGKYLIGASALVFNNENIVILMFSILALVLMYILSKQIFSSCLLALFPPLFLSFEPIFKNQLIFTPLLDLFQLVFLLASFVFFNKALNSKKSLLFLFLSNVFIGFFISTKFFITGSIIFAAFFFTLLLRQDKKRLFQIVITFPVSILILLASYVRVFAFGYSFNRFLGIQKWVFLYHKSQLILPFSVWPLLILNKWYVWYGKVPVISDPQWLITWPIITLITISLAILGVLRIIKLNENIKVLIAWAIFYLIFFSFGQISSRYFVILIPVLYITAFFGVVRFIGFFKKRYYEKNS